MAKAMRGVLPDGRIILTEQEQPGKEPFIAACGGRVDEGEEILTAAKRELLEESGYEAKEFINPYPVALLRGTLEESLKTLGFQTS